MFNPSFSICIPNYNYGKYIGKTLESVLGQSYQNFEVIICDNFSNDNSIDVIESFKDSRIKLIKNRYNIGFSGNLTKVTSYAQNDFIIFLPSDDLLKPDALQDCFELLSSYNEDLTNLILSYQTEQINSNNTTVVNSVFNSPYFNKYEKKFTYRDDKNIECFEFAGKDIYKIMLEKIQMPFSIQSMVFSKDLFDKGEGANAPRLLGADKFLCLKMLSFNPRVICVEKPLACFNAHGSSMALAQLTNLKQYIDDYMYTLEFSSKNFEETRINKKSMIKEFLDNRCLKIGLTQLVYGSYMQSFRIFCFCFASYPIEAFKRPRTWVLLFLLLLGPFSKIISTPMYYIYRKLQ